jgi:hypothetical protein
MKIIYQKKTSSWNSISSRVYGNHEGTNYHQTRVDRDKIFYTHFSLEME